LGFAALTRTDSLIIATLVFLFIFGANGGFNKINIHIVLALFVFVAMVLAQTLFRINYYGAIVPNTYLLKMDGIPVYYRITAGLQFVIPLAKQLFLPFFVTGVFFCIYRQTTALLLCVPLISLFLYQLWTGGDAWPYWRFTCPGTTLFFIPFAVAVVVIADRLASLLNNKVYTAGDMHHTRIIVIMVIAVFGIISLNFSFLKEAIFVQRPYLMVANLFNVNIAVAINEITDKDATVGVAWAGAIPYYSGRHAIDFHGKCDRYIASLKPDLRLKHHPGHNKYDLNYSIKFLKPTYVQTSKIGMDDLTHWVDQQYITVNYKGFLELPLLKNSENVYWDRISGTVAEN
jgi:hypothetical protein